MRQTTSEHESTQMSHGGSGRRARWCDDKAMQAQQRRINARAPFAERELFCQKREVTTANEAGNSYNLEDSRHTEEFVRYVV